MATVSEYYGERTTFLSVTAFLMMGMLLTWSGLYYLNDFWHFATIDPITYQITKLALSIFVLLFAAYSFSQGLVSEGIVVMYTGLSSTVFCIGTLFIGVEGLNRMDALFSIGILMSALLFYGRNRFVAIAALILGLTMSVPYVLGYRGESILMGLGLLVSGILFMYYALGNLLYGDTGKNYLKVPQNDRSVDFKDDRSKAYTLAIVPGLFTFALELILVGLQFIMVSEISLSYCVAEALLSSAVIIFAVYGLMRGVVTESVMMLIFGISCFVFSIVALSGSSPSLFVDVLMATVLSFTGLVFLSRHDYVMGIGSILFAVGGFMEALFLLYHPAGCLIVASGVIFLLCAMDKWVIMETGCRLLSFGWIRHCLTRH